MIMTCIHDNYTIKLNDPVFQSSVYTMEFMLHMYMDYLNVC